VIGKANIIITKENKDASFYPEIWYRLKEKSYRKKFPEKNSFLNKINKYLV